MNEITPLKELTLTRSQLIYLSVAAMKFQNFAKETVVPGEFIDPCFKQLLNDRVLTRLLVNAKFHSFYLSNVEKTKEALIWTFKARFQNNEVIETKVIRSRYVAEVSYTEAVGRAIKECYRQYQTKMAEKIQTAIDHDDDLDYSID